MGKTTKIDWAESSFNPVTGCHHGCQYCYARRIANRFAGYKENDLYYGETWKSVGEFGFKMYEVTEEQYRKTATGDLVRAPYPFGFSPTFHKYRLDEPQKWKEPRDVFVCSMADLFAEYIPDNWIYEVFDACNKAPHHRYYFLTKNPQRYLRIFEYMDRIAKKLPDNFWFGTTVTRPDQPYFFRRDANCFLSIEPIQEDFPVDYRNLSELGIKWIIVGAETGNRIGKVKPEKKWILHLAETTARSKIPLFMKESLHELMGSCFVQEKPDKMF